MRDFASDTFFSQGTTHTVCQDYALSGVTDGYPFIIAADGCSGSPNSDTGARILAYCAANLVSLLDNESPEAAAKSFGQIAIRQARNFLLPGLANPTLDATLVVAIALKDKFRAAVYGDGFLFVPGKTISVECTKSAPFYLNYLDDSERLTAYQVARPMTSVNGGEAFAPETQPVVFDFSYDEIDRIAVGSDGWATFTNDHGNILPISEIENELLAFKTTQGEFVQRRIRNGLIRKIFKNGFSAADDLSFAAMIKE